MNSLKLNNPLLIIGMHRSGTSMVTRLLHLCGLYLGESQRLMPAHPDNPEGYWESLDFVGLDDRILARMKGAWDLPPTGDPNPAADPDLLADFRVRAETCIAAAVSGVESRPEENFAPGAWGWKDPRSSLLLPFWSQLMPEMKAVVCLRNPMEVAASLTKRNGFSTQLGLHLWQKYNERLEQDLQAGPGIPNIVTHYEALLNYPEQELRRLTEWLGWAVPDEVVTAACATINPELRHQRQGLRHQAQDGVDQLYDCLCRRAGPNHAALPEVDRVHLENLNRQGEARFQAGDFLLAKNYFRQVVVQDPAHLSGRNNLACALWQMGRHEEALNELGLVLDHDPDDQDATWNLGQFLRQLNRPDDATQLLQSYLDRNPAAGDISQELNRWKEAGAVSAT